MKNAALRQLKVFESVARRRPLNRGIQQSDGVHRNIRFARFVVGLQYRSIAIRGVAHRIAERNPTGALR